MCEIIQITAGNLKVFITIKSNMRKIQDNFDDRVPVKFNFNFISVFFTENASSMSSSALRNTSSLSKILHTH